MLSVLFVLIGAAAVVQLMDRPKPKPTPIPTAPHEFKMPKEMLVQYSGEPVFITWADPDAWMLRHDHKNGIWDWVERTVPPRQVLWENLKDAPKKKK
jgi:hypothetical protein